MFDYPFPIQVVDKGCPCQIEKKEERDDYLCVCRGGKKDKTEKVTVDNKIKFSSNRFASKIDSFS